MKATGIPHKSRDAVAKRSTGRCERCGMGAADWHHRRSRSVRDNHVHCPCNGVHLCRSCHTWAHLNPKEAQATGFIVSRYAMPRNVSFKRWDGATVQPDCTGAWANV